MRNPLTPQLKLIARLLAGGCKTKVFIVKIGGFDTHADQVEKYDPTMGGHAALMYHISSAMNAFQLDLRARGLEERVLSVTTSEFGRRIQSNGSYGTDHGTGGPLFIFGQGAEPGVVGKVPDLSQGNVEMQFDYRLVYANELEEKKEKIEEEIKERVEAISRDATGVARGKETLTANEQALLSREVEIRALEGQLKGRERDLETRERTITVEMTRLEKERADVQDLWEKVSVSKKDLAAVIDEKMVAELERRNQELDDMYLKLADREDSIHKDEHRLEGEWSRLHSIEEELSELARILKSREDELKRLEG